MLIALADTTYFSIAFEDSAFAADEWPVFTKRRAAALKQTCDSDFLHLADLFGVPDFSSADFGEANRIVVSVLHLPPNYGLNNSFQEGKPMWINLTSFSDPDAPAVANGSFQNWCDDAVRALFIAELAEVFMSYRSYKMKVESWAPNRSDGEALSRLLASEFYPAGFYNLIGPSVNDWLRSNPRADFITKNKASDSDPFSYGCSLLFLSYLKSQLGFSVKQIIAHGGPTPEDTYGLLTGKAGGKGAFLKLLEFFFPEAAGLDNYSPSDDPFPLHRASTGRITSLEVQEVPIGAAEVIETGYASVIPPGCLGPAKYPYTLSRTPQTLRVTARPERFAQPHFSWSVNGVSLLDSATVLKGIDASVSTDVPSSDPNQTSEMKHLTVFCKASVDSSGGAWSASLDIEVDNLHDGHVLFEIDITINEKTGSANGTTSRGVTGQLNLSSLTFEGSYKQDSDRCLAHLHRLVNQKAFTERVRALIAGHRPGPPHTGWALTSDEVRALSDDIDDIRRSDRETADRIAAVASEKFGLPRQTFGAH